MRVCRLRLKNFQSFGPEPTAIELDELTYVLGPNGSGKTAVLEALSRLFSPLLAQRKIRVEDFHVPVDRSASGVHAEQPTLWLEVDIEFPEADRTMCTPRFRRTSRTWQSRLRMAFRG